MNPPPYSTTPPKSLPEALERLQNTIKRAQEADTTLIGAIVSLTLKGIEVEFSCPDNPRCMDVICSEKVGRERFFRSQRFEYAADIEPCIVFYLKVMNRHWEEMKRGIDPMKKAKP